LDSLIKSNEENQKKQLEAVSEKSKLQEMLDLLQLKLQTANELNDDLAQKLKAEQELYLQSHSEWDLSYKELISQKSSVEDLHQKALNVVAQVQLDLQDVTEAKNVMSREILDLKVQIDKLSENNSELEAQKEEMQMQLGIVAQEKGVLEGQLQTVEQRMLVMQTGFSEKSQALETSLDSLRAERTALLSRLESSSQEIEILCQKCDSLAAELQDESTKNGQLQQLCTSQSSNLDRLQQDLLHEQVARNQLTKDNESYQRQLDNAHSLITSHEMNKEVMGKQIAQLTDDNLSLQSKVENLESRLEDFANRQFIAASNETDLLKKEIQVLKEQLEGECSQHNIQVTETSHMILSLRKELGDLQASKDELDILLKNSEQNMMEMQQKLLQKCKFCDETLLHVKQLKEDLCVRNRQIEELNTLQQNLSEKIASAEMEAELCKSQLCLKSDELVSAQCKISNLESSLNSIRIELDVSKVELDEKSKDLTQARDSHAAYLQQLEHEKSHLKQTVENKSAEISNLQMTIGSRDKELEQVKMRTEQLEKELELERAKVILSDEACLVLSTAVNEMNDKDVVLQRELNTLSNQNALYAQDVASLTKAKEGLENKLANIDNELASQKQKCLVIEMEKAEAVQSADERQSALDTYIAANKALEIEVENLKMQLQAEGNSHRTREELLSTIVKLKAEMDETKIVADAVKSDLEDKVHNIDALEYKLRHHQEQNDANISRLTGELTEKMNEIEIAHIEISSLHNRLHLCDVQLQGYVIQVEEQNREMEALKTQVTSFKSCKDEIQQLTQYLSDKEDVCATLRSEVDRLHEENLMLRKEISLLNSQHQSYASRSENLQSDLEVKDREILLMKDERTELMAEIENLEKRHASDVQQVTELTARVEELQQCLDDSLLQRQSLSSELKENQVILERIEKEAKIRQTASEEEQKTLKCRLQDLGCENDALMSKLQAVQAERVELDEKIIDLSNENLRLRESLNKLVVEKNALDCELKKSTNNQEDVKKQVRDFRETVQLLQRTLTEAEADKAAKKVALAEMRQQLNSAEGELTAVGKMCIDLQQEMETLRKSECELNETVKSLNSVVSSLSDEKQCLEQKLTLAGNTEQRLTATLSELKEQGDTLHAINIELAAKADLLKVSLDEEIERHRQEKKNSYDLSAEVKAVRGEQKMLLDKIRIMDVKVNTLSQERSELERCIVLLKNSEERLTLENDQLKKDLMDVNCSNEEQRKKICKLEEQLLDKCNEAVVDTHTRCCCHLTVSEKQQHDSVLSQQSASSETRQPDVSFELSHTQKPVENFGPPVNEHHEPESSIEQSFFDETMAADIHVDSRESGRKRSRKRFIRSAVIPKLSTVMEQVQSAENDQIEVTENKVDTEPSARVEERVSRSDLMNDDIACNRSFMSSFSPKVSTTRFSSSSSSELIDQSLPVGNPYSSVAGSVSCTTTSDISLQAPSRMSTQMASESLAPSLSDTVISDVASDASCAAHVAGDSTSVDQIRILRSGKRLSTDGDGSCDVSKKGRPGTALSAGISPFYNL
jgi:chromosome segregation ATPase